MYNEIKSVRNSQTITCSLKLINLYINNKRKNPELNDLMDQMQIKKKNCKKSKTKLKKFTQERSSGLPLMAFTQKRRKIQHHYCDFKNTFHKNRRYLSNRQLNRPPSYIFMSFLLKYSQQIRT